MGTNPKRGKMRVVLFSLIAAAAASNSLLGDMPMNKTAPSLLEKDAFSTSNPVAKMFLQAATMNMQPTELDAPGPAHKRPNAKPTELDAPGPAHKRPARDQILMKSPEEEAKIIAGHTLPALEATQKDLVADMCSKDDAKCSKAVLATVSNCHRQASGDGTQKIHNFLKCVMTDHSLLTTKLSESSELVKLRKEYAELPEQAILLEDAQKHMCDSLKSIKAKGACNTRVEADVKDCYKSADSVHDLGMCLEKAVSKSESVTLLEGESEPDVNMQDTQVLPSLAVLKASVKELHCEKVADAQHKADCQAKMETIVTDCYNSCHGDETKLDKVYCFQGCNEASIDEQMGAGQFQAMLQADKPHLDDNYNMGYDLAMKHQQAEIDAGLLDIEGANKEAEQHKQALIQSAKRHAAKLKAASVAAKNAMHKAKMKLGKTKDYYNYEEPTYDGHDAVEMN